MKRTYKQILNRALTLLVSALTLTGCGNGDNALEEIINNNPSGPAFDPYTTPLTLEAAESGEIRVLFNWAPTIAQPIKYAINGVEQGDITAETSTDIDANHKATSISVNAGDRVQFWSNNSALAIDNGGKFVSLRPSVKCYLYGNLMSMIDDGPDGFANDKTITGDWALSRLFDQADKIYNHPDKKFVLPATTLSKGCYFDMFDQCTNLTSIPEDLLPAGKDGVGTLAEQCYRQMFCYCLGLKSIPEKLLPATTLTKQCYNCMFGDCVYLTSIPEKLLPATTLAERCYETMFAGCTGLTSIPANLLPATTLKKECYKEMFMYIKVTSLPAGLLPATNLADGCYYEMFQYAEIVDVPYSLLPATTLTKDCYNKMFRLCKNLLTSPKLGASTLVSGCYSNMFNQCSKLGSVTCLATAGFDQGGLSEWLSGAGSSAGSRVLHVKTGDTHSDTEWGIPTYAPLWTLEKDQP